MALAKGYKQLVEEATRKIRTISVDEALKKHNDPDVVFVDLRDVRELERDGMIAGALHAPRGMLEFWVDPDSPYYREVFGSGKELVFYCAAAWRSALATATVQEMGVPRVCHLDGGFTEWKKRGGPVAPRAAKAGNA